jgi:hypothetical protein
MEPPKTQTGGKMDVTMLSRNPRVVDGLAGALNDAEEGLGDLARTYVDVGTALLVAEVAMRCEDRPDWFPAGKWATIQSIQGAIDAEVGKIFNKTQEKKR